MAPSQSVAGEPAAAPARTSAEADLRLLDGVAAGDLRAFEHLYRIYHPRLTRFLGTLARRPELVEELVNDTLLAVWLRPDAFRGASKVSTWIFAIAYRKALKARRRWEEPIEDPDAERRPSLEPGPEQQLGRVQAHAALLDAMRTLSPDHRAVVGLTYFQEIGYREISEIMDCPVDTVKTRMFHARRRLKAALAGELSDWL